MFIELLWIDSLVRSELTPTMGDDGKPTVQSGEVVAALGVRHRGHTAVFMNHRKRLNGFADLCWKAGMPSASDVAKRVPVSTIVRPVARHA